MVQGCTTLQHPVLNHTRSAMTWLSGYPAAQCLLTKCDGGDDTLIDYEALYSCKFNGAFECIAMREDK